MARLRMRLLKRVQAMFVVGAYGAFVVLGGCDNWRFSGADTGDKGDAGSTQEKAECTDKLAACRNKCYQADLGRPCTRCCEQNAEKCDRGESYSFNACLDL